MPATFERALGSISARVSVCAGSRAIAVAFSGGLDSSVLLHLAARYAVDHQLPLHAFHIHHGLSPHADAWLEHCRIRAEAYGIFFAARRVDVRHADGRGVEEAARVARYGALGELCREQKVALLLTAHHQDDQAETVLLQFLRGAGLPGLSGMAELTVQHELLGPGVALGRPLLAVSRKQLQQAVRQYGLQYVEDESNTDARYRRNALRHQVVPLLEQQFPGFAGNIARSAGHVQSAQHLLEELAAIDLASCRAAGLDEWRALDRERVKQLPQARADNLLRYWLTLHGMRSPSAAQLDELRRQMLDAAADTYPVFRRGSLRVVRSGKLIALQPDQGAPAAEPVELKWQGELAINVPQWRGRLLFEPVPSGGLDKQRLLGARLLLRPRAGHERLKIAFNRPSRTLKNLYQEGRIAPWLRNWLPLVYLDSDLVLASGLGMDVRHLIATPGVRLRWESA